jgi:5-formyltetrahydrofolate cyclo-ligase
LAALPQLRRARVVASYAPTQGELDPNGFRALLVPPLMAPQLLFPRVCGSHNLSLHACEPAELHPGAFGILEPVATVPRVEVQKAEVILLPGLAFDRCGARLGYGKGYYDSLLAGFGESTETGAAEVAGTTLVAAPAKPEVAGVDVLPRLPRLSEAGEARPLLVGISYDETLFEHIPSEPHDVRVDAVVTPTQTLWATHG